MVRIINILVFHKMKCQFHFTNPEILVKMCYRQMKRSFNSMDENDDTEPPFLYFGKEFLHIVGRWILTHVFAGDNSDPFLQRGDLGRLLSG